MNRRTKIICTIGPATNSLEKIKELINVGMNVARLNFSHGTHEEHLKVIEFIKKARDECNKPIAIMLDTKGPEIRVGVLKNDLNIKARQKYKLVQDAKADDEIPINPFSVLQGLKESQKILFDDGYISSKIVSRHENEIIIEFQNDGILKSRKGVNIPNAKLPLPAVTEQDVIDLKFGCKHQIDIVAASFIRSAEHILTIKQILEDEGQPEIMVIAKIESSEGVDNFDEIVDVADGIMIARGDLGVEVDLSLVPKLQKIMVAKCSEAYKPVVIATQMLESMINNPRPTRAEVSDVANAIYDSASCVMLSGETAAGKYPIETVIQMKQIIEQAEQDFDYKNFFYKQAHTEREDVSTSVAIATVKTAYNSNAKAIFALTSSGFTARLLTRLRPEIPVIVLTKKDRKYHQMAFNWGLIPVCSENWKTEFDAFKILSHFAIQNDYLTFGDLIVLISTYPFGAKGSTNMMMVESIGNVLVRGYKGFGRKVKGKITKVLFIGRKETEDIKGKIIILRACNEKYLDLMKASNGVILQNSKLDAFSESFAMSAAQKYDIPLITRANNAIDILEEDEEVFLDPQKALIYKPSEEEK